MYFYGNDEQRKEHAHKISAEYKAAAGLYFPLLMVLTKWNGRCYNKRFVDDLKEVSGNIRLGAEKRTIGSEEIVDVISYEPKIISCVVICRIRLHDKRVDSDEAKIDASDRYDKHIHEAERIEEYLPKIPEIKEQIKALKKQLDDITDDIPYHLRDLYNIDRRW